MEKGKDPQALRDRPELHGMYQHYIDSFYTLSARRPVNNVEGAIPLTEIVAYLQIYPWYDNDLFIRYMIALDHAYLQHKVKLSDNKTIDFGSSN